MKISITLEGESVNDIRNQMFLILASTGKHLAAKEVADPTGKATAKPRR